VSGLRGFAASPAAGEGQPYLAQVDKRSYAGGSLIFPQILHTGGSTLQSHLWLPVSDSGHFQAPETKYSFSRDAIDFLFSPPFENTIPQLPAAKEDAHVQFRLDGPDFQSLEPAFAVLPDLELHLLPRFK
jgi:hypothetical protein